MSLKLSREFPTSKSFEIVIPLFNDEENFINLLNSLVAVGVRPVDIIVSMSGPRGTIDELARRYNFRLNYSDQKQNPSITRNKGAGQVEAAYIVFLDSDVLVTREWKEALDDVSVSRSALLTGDTVHISNTPNWLEKFWFARIKRHDRKYINGANIIVEKDLFQILNGFDESLDSGEDYDFSMRSSHSGTPPVLNKAFKVFHEGYPKSIKEFIKREHWHASGDLGSLKAFLQSKVMIASTLYALLVTIVIFSFISASWIALLISISGCLLLSLTLTIYKMGLDGKATLVNTIIMNLYLAGRGSALVSTLLRPISAFFNRK